MMKATSDDERRAEGRTAARTALRTAIQAAGIPSPDIWAGISADERAYRSRVLNDIARRVAEEGVHTAIPSDDRGRRGSFSRLLKREKSFMPRPPFSV